MSVRKRTWKSGPEGKKVTKQAWAVDYFDSQGVRRQKQFELKRDADSYAATTHVDLQRGIHVSESASATIAEAGSLWLETASQNGLERSTLNQYRQHLDLHIKPFIGQRKLSALSVPIVRGFEDQLRTEGRSNAMIRKVLTSLSSIVNDSQERGLVAKNVVRDMRARRSNTRTPEMRAKGKLKIGVDIPTPDEIKRIVKHAEPPWRALIITAIFTGLRASELRGLRWAEVDLKGQVIHVRQRADRYNEIGPPKSISSIRTVPIGPFVKKTLMEWKLACPRPKVRVGGKVIREAAHDRHLVFPNTVGNVESHPNILQRGVKPVMMKAGLGYSGLHSFRHFYASWCINRKEDGGLELPPKTVQERLGHSTITMTYDRYGHLFPSRDDVSELGDAEAALLR